MDVFILKIPSLRSLDVINLALSARKLSVNECVASNHVQCNDRGSAGVHNLEKFSCKGV